MYTTVKNDIRFLNRQNQKLYRESKKRLNMLYSQLHGVKMAMTPFYDLWYSLKKDSEEQNKLLVTKAYFILHYNTIRQQIESEEFLIKNLKAKNKDYSRIIELQNK